MLTPNPNVPSSPDVFEPGHFSLPELFFLQDKIGEPPISAFYKGIPKGVFRPRIEPVLARIYELEQLAVHQKVAWTGLAAITESITRYLAWHERTIAIRNKTRGRVAHASQFVWDPTGRAYRYAVGSDSGEMIKTEILADGSRRPFAVPLTSTAYQMIASVEDLGDIAPWVSGAQAMAVTDEMEHTVGKDNAYFRCSICEQTERYQPGSRQLMSSARARMMKHLKQAKTDRARHRILLAKWKGN